MHRHRSLALHTIICRDYPRAPSLHTLARRLGLSYAYLRRLANELGMYRQHFRSPYPGLAELVDDPAPNGPPIPTSALPGTPEKVFVLQQRFEAGQELHHPADARRCAS